MPLANRLAQKYQKSIAVERFLKSRGNSKGFEGEKPVGLFITGLKGNLEACNAVVCRSMLPGKGAHHGRFVAIVLMQTILAIVPDF